MGADGLAEIVLGHTTSLRRSGPYRPPTPDEVDRLPALVDALAGASDPGPAARALGLAVVPTGGRLALVPPEPGGAPWVLLAVTPGVVPDLVVEVPHPYADLHTEQAALAVAARMPSALLLQAGAHRVAGGVPGSVRRVDYPADVAFHPDAVFSRLAEGLVARLGVAQLQWHGFADRPGVDVVVSSGASVSGPLHDAVVDGLAGSGLRVFGPDDPRTVDLAGRRNVQGVAAACHGTEFVHLEVSRSVRDDPERLRAVADAVPTTW